MSMPAKLGPPALFTNGDYDEKPVHDIKLSYDFYISESEVTARQFAAFRMDFQDAGRFPPYATGMSWDDAAAFCRWLSQKEERKCDLPTEAEWECAARQDRPSSFPVATTHHRLPVPQTAGA